MTNSTTNGSRISAIRSLPAVFKTAHPGRDATCETAPRHIWGSAVMEIAGVTHDEAQKYAGARISRAYLNGEPAWMAADMVRELVRGGLVADRADGEVDGLRGMMRSAFKASR